MMKLNTRWTACIAAMQALSPLVQQYGCHTDFWWALSQATDGLHPVWRPDLQQRRTQNDWLRRSQ